MPPGDGCEKAVSRCVRREGECESAVDTRGVQERVGELQRAEWYVGAVP